MKANLGNDKLKKSYFPISLDSSTTANFGECLPLFCHELVPNSHLSLNIRDAVRFAPLSFPTFGKAYLKTYAFCHKISDLYPPFNDLLAQTPYSSGSGSTYVPNVVPSVPLFLIWLSVLTNCDFTFYKTDLSKVKVYNSELASSSPFVYSDLPFELVNSITQSVVTTDVLSDESISASLGLWLLSSLSNRSNNLSIQNEINSASSYYSYLSRSFSNDGRDYLFYDHNVSNISSFYASGVNDVDGSPLYGRGRPIVTFGSADFIFPLGSINGYLQYANDSGIVGAGSVAYVDEGVRFVSSIENSELSDVVVCIRLNDSGKLLRKIFMGLGYQISPIDRPVSLLPLYAYFKSYFETFAPKRFIKFEQTLFSRLINVCVNTGLEVPDVIMSRNNVVSTDIGWSHVIDDLLGCFYTKDTDYFSSQIIGLINDYGSSLTQKYLAETNDDNVVLDSLVSDPSSGLAPRLDLSGNVAHTQAQQNILSRLTQFVNRRSVVGSKIADLLKSVFGISKKDVDDSNYFIGSSSTDVNFSDVFSTAETSEASLGEYAGKALGVGSSDNFNVDVTTHSIVLAFSVVVPRTQYVQGVSPILSHVNAEDFYNQMFDGLTLLPTRKSNLFTGDGFLVPDDESNSFGNSPIYSEYKTKVNGVLTGDLSLRSTRSSYDSFTMDELISGSEIIDYSDVGIDNSIGRYRSSQYYFPGIVAGTMWRYLGRWLWLGRFDRIFVNNRINFNDFSQEFLPPSIDGSIVSSRNTVRTDDNLILHHVVDMSINAPMVPLSGSFLTDDLLSLDSNGLIVKTE